MTEENPKSPVEAPIVEPVVEKVESPAEEPAMEPDEEKEEDIQEMTTLHERTIAALSYVGFFAIVPFYLKKESKFCRFHGKQGMLIALFFFFAKLLLVLDFFMDLALITQFIIFVYMSYGALSGKWKKFPWIYKWSCDLESVLSLKSKSEETEDQSLKPEDFGTEKQS